MRQTRTRDRRGERGSVFVIAALAMAALILFAALAIDVGAVWSTRTQGQNANDSAALAAAAAMIVNPNPTPAVPNPGPAKVDTTGAIAAGTTFAAQNETLRNGAVKVRPGDFEFGTWNLAKRTLTVFPTGSPELDPNTPPGRPDLITGVRVKVASDGSGGANKPAPVFLSQLLGRTGFNVQNEAVAYLGFEGEFEPGEFDLPVAIDGCKITTGGGGGGGDNCGKNFCQTVASPPNPCALRWSQGTDPVTCLDFSSTNAQNACWTVFDDSSPSINNPDLKDVVDNGNSGDVEAGDSSYLDNGDKDATLKYIRNKFYFGPTPDPPAGQDRYGPNPATPADGPSIDSWVVKLPVFECQPGRHCSGGGAGKIVGGVCFEIREILAPSGPYGDSQRVIKGRFLCGESSDTNEVALFNKYCRDPNEGQQQGGGCDSGFRADIPRLVQ
jgi:putative Flp pilus-assembly TadE/G-like protein